MSNKVSSTQIFNNKHPFQLLQSIKVFCPFQIEASSTQILLQTNIQTFNKVSSTQIFNNKHLLHSIQLFQREVYSTQILLQTNIQTSNKVSSTQIFIKNLLQSIQLFQREVYSATAETQPILGLTQNVTGSPTRPAYPFMNVLDSSNVKDPSNVKA